MFLEILIFLLFGLSIGLLVGFIPGIHPNTIILFIPLLVVLTTEPILILTFVVSMAVSNIIADIIPSLIFGASDSESSVGIHPAQMLLMEGRGYEAIKLSIIGCIGSILFLIAFLPLIIIALPSVYEFIRPFIAYILILLLGIMFYKEENIIASILCFIAAGAIGILTFSLPIDSALILFPIFAGFFAFPSMLIKIRNDTKIPMQIINYKDEVPFSIKIKAVFMGTIGGIFSGVLPGIGSGEIAGIATIEKNKSYLITLGSIVTANLILSFATIFLINKARSGVAIATSELMTIGFNEILLIISISVISIAVSAAIVLYLSKKMLNKISEVNYNLMNKIILVFLIVLIYLFTGLYGLFIVSICTCLGIVVIEKHVKRGLLMAVLILPTIIFFLGF
ncbi:MAG: tripartite tricarboxylate transporter permease [Candidatus Aenigmarchaeota archaeon]|nr:tripartite tricarboxylate transporter permease [Candidatus Aenigmarchaeota archaeon]